MGDQRRRTTRWPWVTGQVKYLRSWLEEHDVTYVLATRCSDTLITMAGGQVRADELGAALPSRAWRRISAGAGAHGPSEYDWARIPIRMGWARGRGHWLLARRTRPAWSCDHVAGKGLEG
jgi:hypothetical protein